MTSTTSAARTSTATPRRWTSRPAAPCSSPACATTLTVGGLTNQFKSRFQRQAYNYAGTGNVDGSAVTAGQAPT